jgi:hypothetical protein
MTCRSPSSYADPDARRCDVSTIDAVAMVPHPTRPGPEMASLHRFFRDVTWTGTILPGGMAGLARDDRRGPRTHRTIQDGLWIVGDYEQEQRLADGTFVLTWRLHWVAGWDPDAAEFRATNADNCGHAGVMHGRLDRDVLTFESLGEGPVRLRMVWNLADPEAMTWRIEMSVGGAPFALVEEYRLRRVEAST